MDAIRRRVIAALLLSGAALARADDEEVSLTPALHAAEAWLAILDIGAYGDSWDRAAPMLQGAMPRLQWETGLESTRAPLGTVVSRKLRQARFTRTLPGAPDGEYFVLQFDTRFEKRPLTTEVVTPVKGGDGTWRVSGYVIR